MNTKQAWRAWARVLSQPPTAEQSTAVVTGLIEFLSDHPGRVLTYRPMRDEIDLDSLASVIGSARLLVTRTPPRGPLTVHDFAGVSEQHTFGFSQPTAGSPRYEPEELDIVLVPGVLFAVDGVRLGRGQGYYDQLLSCTRPGTLRIGITVASMVVRSLPATDDDIAMTHLATETGVTPVAGAWSARPDQPVPSFGAHSRNER